MTTNKTIHFLVIGHCCHDWTPEEIILGGTASYTALFAKKCECEASILTSFGPDFLFNHVFEEQQVSVYRIDSDETTQFTNTYVGDTRSQVLSKRAVIINQSDLLNSKSFDIVLLGPIANEVDVALIKQFPGALLASTIQGFLRSWDDKGKVRQGLIDINIFKGIDILIFSEEDINQDENALFKLKQIVPHVVLTRASNGASIYLNDVDYHVDSLPTKVVDSTGAGDVFAAAYLLSFHKTKDVIYSARYAHCAASLTIEGLGIESIPGDTEVQRRLANYNRKSKTVH